MPFQIAHIKYYNFFTRLVILFVTFDAGPSIDFPVTINHGINHPLYTNISGLILLCQSDKFFHSSLYKSRWRRKAPVLQVPDIKHACFAQWEFLILINGTYYLATTNPGCHILGSHASSRFTNMYGSLGGITVELISWFHPMKLKADISVNIMGHRHTSSVLVSACFDQPLSY